MFDALSHSMKKKKISTLDTSTRIKKRKKAWLHRSHGSKMWNTKVTTRRCLQFSHQLKISRQSSVSSIQKKKFLSGYYWREEKKKKMNNSTVTCDNLFTVLEVFYTSVKKFLFIPNNPPVYLFFFLFSQKVTRNESRGIFKDLEISGALKVLAV